MGKFSVGIPKIFVITKMLKDLNLKTGFTVNFLDKCHVAIKLFSDKDFNFLGYWKTLMLVGYRLDFSNGLRISLWKMSPLLSPSRCLLRNFQKKFHK